MNKYEVMVVLKPLLPDDIRKDVVSKIEKLVEGMKGRVAVSEVWGKKHLAYDIQGHTEGYYILWGVELDPGKVAKLKSELLLISEVLRSLVLKVEEFNLKEIK